MNGQKQKEVQLGKLKIFFGMSAGVGKTFAMLQEAHQKVKENVHVSVGVVNTHGRKETEALTVGLPVIPEKWIEYKGLVFKELDVETILEKKPDLVLIDELAHSNVPGSRHPKRWQDIIEIIDAGIDVYTTLNVQHIESRKDIISSITGIQTRETVPDLVLERASAIELIDIPPNELLQRLREGKVYLGDQSKIAAENFFKEENLMALRQMALRFTAEKVDHDLHGLQAKGWKIRERLMVAVDAHSSSDQLIRRARRFAFELDAPWIAVYVDTGEPLETNEQFRLKEYLSLARELGAEVITTHDIDIAAGLERIARQRDITRIVMGRSENQLNWLAKGFRASLADQLEKNIKNVDLIILKQDKPTGAPKKSFSMPPVASSSVGEYLSSFILVLILSLIGVLLGWLIGYKSIGFLFLLGILVQGFFVGIGPLILTTLLSSAAWILFVPPLEEFALHDIEDAAMIVIYFCVALTMILITHRLRAQEYFLRQREERTERLHEIERDISKATNFQYLRLNVISRLENQFPGKFDILVKGSNDQLVFDSNLALFKSEKEKVAASWALQRGKLAGRATDTLPSADGLYFPIKLSAATSAVGVLVYQQIEKELPYFYSGSEQSVLSIDDINFIQTVAHQLAFYLERYIFENKEQKQDYTKQMERIHQSIFHSLNRGFYRSLEKTAKINRQIQQLNVDEQNKVLLDKMEKSILRIEFTTRNIIAMSEFDSGVVRFVRERHDVKKLIETSLKELQYMTTSHEVILKLPREPVFVQFDYNLLKLAVNNMILNGIERAAPGQPITLQLEIFELEFAITLIDIGSPIPEETLQAQQSTSDHSKAWNLELAIIRSVVDIHQGRIEMRKIDEQTNQFTIILPA